MSGQRLGRWFVFLGALLLLGLVVPPAARAGTYQIIVLDSPSGLDTELLGINNSRLVTGVDFDANFISNGLVFRNGVGHIVQAPGAVDTEFYQVNNAGKVAASFYGQDGIYHAAVFDTRSASWTYLPDIAGAFHNLAGGINNHGLVIGNTFDANFTHADGWTWNGSQYSFFDVPGADPTTGGTITYSVNDRGQIVGYFTDSNGDFHGYLKTGSIFTQIDFPGGSQTIAYGINDAGVVVGRYVDSADVRHSFLWQDGVFTPFDLSFGTGTRVTGINDRGDLVGFFSDEQGKLHGFEALVIPEPGTLALLGAGVLVMRVVARRRRR
jgi:probable HAF family extracellular repeat protein